VRIAVTGIGILTPLGDDLAKVGEGLREARCTVAPAAEPAGVGLSELRDFEATRYANVRGLRIYNRTTRLGICAAKLALVDAGLDGAGAVPGEELGLVTASSYGHMDTLVDYDRSLMTLGLQKTNPALMPLAIPSAPGAMIALAFGAKAFCTTLSDGAVSSTAALGLGARLLHAGRARACLVVGAFAICREMVLSAQRAGMLAPAGAYRVLDRGHTGTAFGEAGVAVVLERAEDARARGAGAKAFVAGHASAFAAAEGDTASALARACRGSLAMAGIPATSLALVSSGANGVPAVDRAEAAALGEVLGTARPPITAVKANLGETVDAAGLLQTIAALWALRSRQVPAIAGLHEPEATGLRYALPGATDVRGEHALVTSTHASGACAAVVLRGVS
jgi:3-oxoacyl-[acyl-carrier-protein] synthase II